MQGASPLLWMAVFLSHTDSRAIAGAQMKVIGAGFGRTGTASMHLALNQLGYQTYHMTEVIPQSSHSRAWGALWDETGTLEDALDLVAKDGYNASMDFPICIAYKELMRLNPAAKVILTLRDSGEKWAASFLETIARNTAWMSAPPFTFLTPGLGALHKWMYTSAGMSLDEQTWMPSLQAATDAYSAWAEEVQRHVPKDRLLVFHVGDGWEKLCKFLEVVDCPTGPFPRAPNDRVFMQRLAIGGSCIVACWRFWPVALVLLVVFCFKCAPCCGRFQGAPKQKPA